MLSRKKNRQKIFRQNFYEEQNVGLSKDALRMLTYGLWKMYVFNYYYYYMVNTSVCII